MSSGCVSGTDTVSPWRLGCRYSVTSVHWSVKFLELDSSLSASDVWAVLPLLRWFQQAAEKGWTLRAVSGGLVRLHFDFHLQCLIRLTNLRHN